MDDWDMQGEDVQKAAVDLMFADVLFYNNA